MFVGIKHFWLTKTFNYIQITLDASTIPTTADIEGMKFIETILAANQY